MAKRSKAGGLVPLEKAAKSKRLPALNPQAVRQSDIGQKFKALVSGRSRPAPRTENTFSGLGGPSKYQPDDEKEE